MEIDSAPLQVTGIKGLLKPASYPYSPDQTDLINQYGLPDSFSILFFEDDFGGTSTRLETWIYSQAGQSFTWINGKLDDQESFQPVSGEILPAPYHPEQFTAFMSLEELIGSTAIDEFLLVPLEKELLEGGENYFADRLTFGLKDGALLYVEAVGFVAGEDSPSPAQETEEPPSSRAESSEGPPATPLPWPNSPMVFASDQSAPNYDQCHQENSCFLQVFYNPAPLDQRAGDLTGPLGFVAASDPSLSPDGKSVAFTGFVEGASENHIYIVNTDGSGLRVMTLKGFNHGHPSWSPDGKYLVVMSRKTEETNYHLYIINVESREASQLTSGPYMDRFPDWSPDGNQIAFHSNRADSNPETCWPDCLTSVYLVKVDSGELNPLGSQGKPIKGSGFAWSPDGTRLAYHSNQAGSYDIYITDLDGSIQRLTDSTGNEIFPSWSPDGNFITYSGDTSTGKDIVVTPVDNYDPTYYTGKASFDTQPDW
jgi:hypothetical protein